MAVLRTLIIEESNIARVGYDGANDELHVVFRDVPEYTYVYQRVKPIEFCRLINAESVGSYFAKNIKPHPTTYTFAKHLTADLQKSYVSKSTKSNK